MRSKKTLGIGILVIGVLLIIGAIYIKGQVAHGREQISSAKSTMHAGESILGLSPATKGAGSMLGSAGNKKIAEGSAEADKYEKIAGGLQIAGIAALVIGAGMLLYSCCCHKRK